MKANVLNVVFKNSNQFAMLSYEPKRMFRSLTEHGLSSSDVISLTDEPISDIHTNQRNIIIEHQKPSPIQYSIFEDAAVKGSTDSASAGSS